jgi:hypothetical protein
MTKKLFSIFITGLVAITGVVMVSSDTALSFVPEPDCRVEGVVVEASFQEAEPLNSQIPGSGHSERYQFLVHITGIESTELLDDAQSTRCSDFYKTGVNAYFVFPLSVLLEGMTTDSIQGYDVSFRTGRYAGASSDMVLTPRSQQLDEDDSDDKEEGEEQDEVISNDPVSPYSTQNNNFGMGVIAGLLGGLIVLVITLLIKRKK